MIDDAMFDVLGLTQGERDGTFKAVTALETNRLATARTLQKQR